MTATTSPVGAATMSPAMKEAHSYARYLYDCVSPWLQGPVLEMGVGFGTYTSLLLRHEPVVGLDIDEGFLAGVQERFPDCDQLTLVRADLNDPQQVSALAGHKIRSTFSSNVLEHIEDDLAVLSALHEIVLPGGTLCLIVPAHQSLFGYMDSQAGHFRRYTRRSLRDKLTWTGWQVVKTFYINSLGGLGWWVNNRLLSPKPLTSPAIDNQLKFYDRWVVPVSRVIDRVTFPFFGLSVVAIGKKAE
jgi:SAM-dependent methyltransferase